IYRLVSTGARRPASAWERNMTVVQDMSDGIETTLRR
ncbi:unnamed protein product, partial [marine sediment metagenome]